MNVIDRNRLEEELKSAKLRDRLSGLELNGEQMYDRVLSYIEQQPVAHSWEWTCVADRPFPKECDGEYVVRLLGDVFQIAFAFDFWKDPTNIEKVTHYVKLPEPSASMCDWDALKPCPKCDSKVYFAKNLKPYSVAILDDDPSEHIVCKECGHTTKVYPTTHEALADWNRD